jgi:YD repeat-containing protein
VSAPTSGTGADYQQLGYDAGGNVTTRRLRSGETLASNYDALNRLTLTDMPNSGSNIFEPDVAYTYDLLGRLLAATDSNTNHATFT